MRSRRMMTVYMMGSSSRRALYTGVTNDLVRRVLEHKSGESEGFTQRYKCDRLVYYERWAGIRAVIEREKEIKHWTRAKKNAPVETMNPTSKDLAADIGDPGAIVAQDPSSAAADSG